MGGWQSLNELDRTWSEKIRIIDERGLIRTIAVLLAHSGDSWFIFPVMALIWKFGNEFWSDWAKIIFLALLGVGAIIQVIKWTFRRKRPAGSWGSMVRKTDPHSFPSGHAAKAGLLLGLGLYLGPAAMRVVVLIYTPLMAFSRTQVGIHYLSDVIVGFLLGVLSSILIKIAFL